MENGCGPSRGTQGRMRGEGPRPEWVTVEEVPMAAADSMSSACTVLPFQQWAVWQLGDWGSRPPLLFLILSGAEEKTEPAISPHLGHPQTTQDCQKWGDSGVPYWRGVWAWAVSVAGSGGEEALWWPRLSHLPGSRPHPCSTGPASPWPP